MNFSEKCRICGEPEPDLRKGDQFFHFQCHRDYFSVSYRMDKWLQLEEDRKRILESIKKNRLKDPK